MAAVEAEQSDAAMPCHEAAAPDQAAHDAACDNCEICHLACAGFMPSAPLATSLKRQAPLHVAGDRGPSEPHHRAAAASPQKRRLTV